MIEELKKYLLDVIVTTKERQERHEKTRFHPQETDSDETDAEKFDPVKFRNGAMKIEAELARAQELLTLNQDVCVRCYVFDTAKSVLSAVNSPRGDIDLVRCGVCGMDFRIPI